MLPPIVMTTIIRSTLRPAILGFVLTLTVMVELLTTQFLFKYGTDIFGNNIGTSAIFEIISLGMLGTIELALPISVLVMTTIYYRNLSKQGQSSIRIKPTLLSSSIFAITCFIWTAFFVPVIQLHEGCLLYDIRAKEKNELMERTSLALFKGSVITSNYFDLKGITDSIYNYTSNKKTEFIENVKQNKLTGTPLIRYQESVNQDIEYNNDLINKLRIKKAQMLSFPFVIFILFYSGMFLGILNKDNRVVLLLISVYLTVLPGIYYLSIYFQKLAKARSLTPFQSHLFYISTILFITFGLYFYTKRHLKEEGTTGGNSIQEQ